MCATAGSACGPTIPTTTVAAVSAGTAYACAIDGSGALSCWGANDHHIIADTSEIAVPVPALFPGNWTQISAGATHVCGIHDGQGYCWGDNSNEECAVTNDRGSDTDVHAPSVVPPPGADAWDKIVAGSTHSCGLAHGALYCWGSDAEGEFGIGAVAFDATATPTAVPPPSAMTTWQDVAAGPLMTCAIATDQTLYCWGDEVLILDGRLGAPGNGSSSPTVVTNIGPTTAVAIGREAVCAIDTGSALWCWGNDTEGAVAASHNAIVLDPVVLPSSSPWTEVSSGGGETCAIDASGRLTCWGTAHAGGLGNGVWDDNSDAMASIATSASLVAVGDNQRDGVGIPDNYDLGCVALAGHLTCWGDDNYGQLGNGTVSRATAPIDTNIVADRLAVGLDHACAADTSGDGSGVVCWGSTELGQATGGPPGGTVASPCRAGAPCDVSVPTPPSGLATPVQNRGWGRPARCRLRSHLRDRRADARVLGRRRWHPARRRR